MRKAFFKRLFQIAKKNKDVILITADTGAIYHDNFRKELPNQYINAGIAEQNAIGIAAGLAMEGKKVYIYGIIPFITMRCFEQIRDDLCEMNLPVTIVGIGSGLDYSTLGFTHHGVDDIALMRALPGITIYNPSDAILVKKCVDASFKEMSGPIYIRLDRTGIPLIYKKESDVDFRDGFSVFKKSKDLYIIASSKMVETALKVSNKLQGKINVGVIDFFRIKPVSDNKILRIIKDAKYIVTLEEHFIKGGIGTVFSEIIAQNSKTFLFKTLGINNQFCRIYDKERKYLQMLYGLDVEGVATKIKEWAKI